MKFTIKKLLRIQKALQDLITAKTAGMSYELNLNLFRVRLVVEDWTERMKAMNDGFLVKDQAGRPVKVLVDKLGNVIKEDSNPVEFSDSRDLKEGEQWGLKYEFDRLAERDEAEKAMNEEELTFEMKLLNKPKIMELSNSGALVGVDYSALIGNLIEE